MNIPPTNQSEVARIKQEITEQNTASWQAIHGLSFKARHAFINTRLTDTLNYIEQYEPVIGEDAVTEIVNWWQAQLVNDIRKGAHA